MMRISTRPPIYVEGATQEKRVKCNAQMSQVPQWESNVQALSLKRDRQGYVKQASQEQPTIVVTVNQLNAMVERAVYIREQQLKEEYQAILQDRLDEQWKQFAEYNRTHVHASGTAELYTGRSYIG